MPPPASPLYLDWGFWSAFAAAAAIVLSQLPPIYLWFRPRRLEVEVHSRMQVTHKIGNANVIMYVMVRNTGGRVLRVKSMQLSLTRDDISLGTFPAQSYYKESDSKSTVLFVPFSLKPDEVWSHTAVFFTNFDRATEKAYRQNESALRQDITNKVAARDPNDKQAVIGDPALIAPFMTLFDQKFLWSPGEYVITLNVSTEDTNAAFTRKYRFTLYESDTAELRSHTEDYKFGGGIAYYLDKHAGVYVPISPQSD